MYNGNLGRDQICKMAKKESVLISGELGIKSIPGEHNSHQNVLIAVFLILVVICYWPTLLMTGRILVFSEDMAHGFFAPITAAYILWQKRQTILEAPAAPSSWGLLLLLLAGIIGVVATLGSSSTFSRAAMMITLAGFIWLLGGFWAFRRALFPWLLLLFTFPIPAVLYGEVTLPLQLLASRLSELTFEQLGMSVVRDGNILELAHQRLSVVEACSGIRSLVTLFFFCSIYAYLCESRWYMRLAVALAAIPAAIGANVLRIVATGLIGKTHPEYTVGTYHEMLGWAAFVLAFGLIFVLHRTVHRVLLQFIRPPVAGGSSQ